MKSRTRLAGAAVALTLGFAAVAAAQTPKAGDVRRVEGTAAVSRGTTPSSGTPLKVSDPVFARDLVTTGEQSKAQMLLGGKAIVTMRELSVLRITDTPGVSTIEVTDGLLKLAVLKDRIKPGDRIDVRTPNAVTAVRGTTIVVEVVKTPSGPLTRLSVLEGFVEITPIDPVTGAPRGAPVRVNDLQETTVGNSGTPSPPQPINRPDAVRLDATFAFKTSLVSPGDDLLKRQLEQAASDAAKLQGAGGNKLPGGGDTTGNISGDDIRSRTVAPPAPPPPSPTGRPSFRGN